MNSEEKASAETQLFANLRRLLKKEQHVKALEACNKSEYTLLDNVEKWIPPQPYSLWMLVVVLNGWSP